jgi:hypothetical protein
MTDREAKVTWRRYLLGILLISSVNWGALAWLHSLRADPDSAAVSRIVSIMQSPMLLLVSRVLHHAPLKQLAGGAAAVWAIFAAIAVALLFARRRGIADRPRAAIPIWAYGLYSAGAYVLAAILAIATGIGPRTNLSLAMQVVAMQLVGATLQFCLGLLIGIIIEALARRGPVPTEGATGGAACKTKFKPARTWRVYLIMWLGSLVPLTAFHLLIDPNYMSVPMRLLAGVGNLFGPYATFVVWPGHFPNGGEFHREWLPYLAAATGGMVVAMILPLFLRRQWGRLTCLAFFTLVLLAWLAMGFMEIGFLVT